MIVKLQGGLGNQMFQYAYGVSEAARRGEEIFFDRSSFEHDTLRHYELDAYDLPIKFKNDPAAESGYWQDEKYFNPDTWHNFILPKVEPNQTCLEMGRTIVGSKDSCFVGVRRADYLWPERIGYHGVMTDEYYCLANLRLPVSLDREYFVFTDDIPWVKANLPEFFITVDVNGPHEKAWDIWLMSLCKHAIIANSTFHWWGAWLGADKSGGKVVAPKQWFANGMKTEIVPERWTKI